MSIRTYFTTLLALMAAVNGHMIMKNPVPFDVDTIDNSPLLADGSNFPCKSLTSNPPPTTSGSPNYMPIGVPQTLSFKGSAVHGGGSCQISLTTDKQPTKSTKWMVIHSIEGGCPANVAGNLPADPNGDGASTFQFSIPDGINPGDYVLAWTWFNKIGNREMYMNCAPITVAPGSGSKKRNALPAPGPKTPGFSKRATSFPDMFVANIAGVSNGCGTLENFDVTFPDPGQSVQTVAGSQFTGPVSCAAAAATPAAASPDAASSSAAAPAPTSAPSESSTAASAPTVVPGVFASGAASSSGAAPAATSAAAPSAAAPVASAAPSAAAPPTSSGSSGAQSGACTNEGDWNCIGGTSFQRCASGQWSVAMQMAAGTSCTPGVSAELTMAKRSLRFSRAHVRRSFGTWGN